MPHNITQFHHTRKHTGPLEYRWWWRMKSHWEMTFDSWLRLAHKISALQEVLTPEDLCDTISSSSCPQSVSMNASQARCCSAHTWSQGSSHSYAPNRKMSPWVRGSLSESRSWRVQYLKQSNKANTLQTNHFWFYVILCLWIEKSHIRNTTHKARK